MPGRALLIGGALEQLTGVDNDIAAMKEALENRGLTVDPEFVLTGKNATRAAILKAYEHLISLAVPGEPSVVYYSGHGGRALPPPAAASTAPDSEPEPMDLQFIVPYDFDQSGPGDFRGITSVELSVLQSRLTERTDNVVSIFDCCHSSRMSRIEFKPKRTGHVTSYEELSSHIARMEAEGLRSGLARSAGNHQAVRIVACAPEQLAYEYPGVGGKRIGIMTEALTMALHAVGREKVTWASLLDGIRFRVSKLVFDQRPEAEGPSRRLLFETTEGDHLDSLPVQDIGGSRLQLDCAPLLGVRLGDVFTIVSPSEDTIGELTVDAVGPLFAQGPLTSASGATPVPTGSRAVRVKASAPKLVVSIPTDATHSTELRSAVQDSVLLRVAEGDEPFAAQLRTDEYGGVTVADRLGALHEPRTGTAADRAEAVSDLERLARATALRTLDADSSWALGAKVTYEWGLVEDGQRRPLPEAGAVVRAGQKVYISVRTQNDAPVYVTLVDIGITGSITVLTNMAPSGYRLSLNDQQEYVFGYELVPRALEGKALGWPSDLALVNSRTETVLAFVTEQPQDFSALKQHGIVTTRRPGELISPLTAVVDQVAAGGDRDLPQDRSVSGRYDVRKIDFELEPASGPGFLVEEVAVPGTAGVTPRGTEVGTVSPAGPNLPTSLTVPTAVAVRLDELVVHRNRARFGGADIRVDAIVLTGSKDSPRPAFRARTQRFSRIRDGEPLPLDRMLVFHGPVVDYLDIALWVSRDSDGAVDLGELLSDEAAAFEMQEALAKAGGAMTGLPYAAAAAAMVGVGAIVVNVAYRLLRGTVSDVIGLYRGSRLAGETFGVGRHPAEGARRVQDFSLAYSIDDVS
ncbi:hypothetical protein ABH920_001681 [Catenulispora sp. EB89]|uniref:caspase family protein n=1 Tax=Catenulispora sp. EB89 TaxID=3156257 RepID=UPI0035191406